MIANPVMMTISPLSIEAAATSVNYTSLLPGINYTVVLTATFSGGATATSSPTTFTTLVNCMWCLYVYACCYHILMCSSSY